MLIMIRSLVLFFFLTCCIVISAQSTMTSKRDCDPGAKIILDKLKKEYDSYKSMEVKFDMELELPGQPKEIQKGEFIQDNKKYAIKLKEQEIYADGKTVWVYLKKNKEIQITDMDESSGAEIMSPKQMMSVYEKGDYVYTIVEERAVNNTTYVDIEFKPLSKKSEYTKMRITIDKKANKMITLRVFSRDGSRYILNISEITANKKYDPGIFILNPKSIPGVHIEDLRMN